MKSFRTLAAAVALVAGHALALGPNGQSGSFTAANTAGTTGACTAGTCVVSNIAVPGIGTIFVPADAKYTNVSVQVTGTFSATLQFQCSQDEGATWIQCNALPTLPLGAAPVQSTTAVGNWLIPAVGFTTVRTVCTAFTSGTAVVTQEIYTGAQAEAVDAANRFQSGNSNRVSYSAQNAETVPTAAQALQAVEADGTNRLYLRHLKVCINGAALQTTAGLRTLVLYKTTAASAGGSTFTPNPWDAADVAFAGVARTGALTTTPAIGSVTVASSLASGVVALGTAIAGNAATNSCWEQYFGDAQGQIKPPVVAKAVANGLAIGDLSGGGGGTGSFNIVMDFSTELF